MRRSVAGPVDWREAFDEAGLRADFAAGLADFAAFEADADLRTAGFFFSTQVSMKLFDGDFRLLPLCRFDRCDRRIGLPFAMRPRGYPNRLHGARLRFGNHGVYEQQTREANLTIWLDDLLRDIRFACRQLLRNPSFA